MITRLLLLSNSRDADGGYLRRPQEQIRAFLGSRVRAVHLIPFAGVTDTWDAYADRVRAPFGEMGYDVYSVHSATDSIRWCGVRRLAKFLVVNPSVRIVGLPEGTMLRFESNAVTLLAGATARNIRVWKTAA